MTSDITPMTPEAAQEWIDALPKYKKGIGELRSADGGMCCLGVLAKESGLLKVDSFGRGSVPNNCGKDKYGWLPEGAVGITQGQQIKLGDINDKSITFAPVIAEIKRMFIDKAS